MQQAGWTGLRLDDVRIPTSASKTCTLKSFCANAKWPENSETQR
jgi:hypothetical protein